MDISLRQIKRDDKQTLNNLWEKYDYEFSQYDNRDVNELGLYGCKELDYYWSKEESIGYFIMVDKKLAGFVMVTNLPVAENTETDFQIGEFFVMYKYRRSGVGRQAFSQILDKHKGRWQLVCHPKNLTSSSFWQKVICEFTKGQYQLIKSFQNFKYPDGICGDVFFFNS